MVGIVFLYIHYTTVRYCISFSKLILTKIEICFFPFLKGGTCTAPKIVISINLILCFLVSILSIIPRVQEELPNSGLLQSALVTLYTVYLTWSAVANNPDIKCNPGLLGTAHDNNKVCIVFRFFIEIITKCFLQILGYFRFIEHCRFNCLDNYYLVQFTETSVKCSINWR